MPTFSRTSSPEQARSRYSTVVDFLEAAGGLQLLQKEPCNLGLLYLRLMMLAEVWL